MLTAVCDDALWNVPRLKCERLVEVRDHLCTTDVYSMQQRAPSEILGFVKVRPENYCKVKVWCLRNSCKTVKVSDLPETLPPVPHPMPGRCQQEGWTVLVCTWFEPHGRVRALVCVCMLVLYI